MHSRQHAFEALFESTLFESEWQSKEELLLSVLRETASESEIVLYKILALFDTQ